ncbi:unnamed protein product [Paramecium octaurelia]|uniref:ABC transporter domain-containing protein n=1 Tax=Paramecium octaurelia TaxID=43137 RepID=A0A8S1VNY7_PAROT|nr:unnamed protein product [Paramecium octaurelia]
MQETEIQPQIEAGRLNDTVQSAKSLRCRRVVDIAFQNIEYQVVDQKGHKRDILRNLDGYCPGGEVTAILGASGAGKTSLLNILAARVYSSKTVKLKGKVLANQMEYDSETFSNFAAYVMQNDVLFETLTPREALQFVADLKYTDPELKQSRVEDTIKTMKLERCQNAIIGGPTLKGISGGERKRTSIGFELVTNPSCILLDEPTSGLDSFTAFQIIYELQLLAHEQDRTIIFTIHQPSSDIYLLFDRVMLLVQGKFIYQGHRTKLVGYFKGIGFPCPDHSNPMDYMMSIMHQESQINIDNFPIYFDQYEKQLHPQVLEEIKESSKTELVYKQVETSTAFQINLIAKRAIKGFLRDKIIIKQRVGMAIFMGLLLGYSYYGIGEDSGTFADYTSMSGCMFFLCINLTMSSLFPVVLQFATERDVFLREENSKLYTTFSYFMGKSFVEIPFCLISPIIQELILYWMIGLNSKDGGVVVIHIFVAILTCLNGNSMGLMAGCAFNDIKVATSIVPLVLLPLIIFSGFFANSKQFFVWIGWIQYISPVKYSFEALATNEFDGRSYEFGDPIETLGFEVGQWESIGILIAFVVAIRLGAYMFLNILRSKQQ